MPNLSEIETCTPKMILLGDSGTGKTGALASLVEAGYHLFILDFDNGLDILSKVLAKKPNAKELLKQIHYKTCIDKVKLIGAEVICDGAPKAWPDAMKSLNNWNEENFGAPSTWPEKSVLVIDSLSLASQAAMRFVQVMNPSKDGRQEFYNAQKLIDGFLTMLYNPAFKIPTIVCAHISYNELETGIKKGFPASIGQALSPKIGRYFNTMIQAKTIGSGPNAKHVLRTAGDSLLDLKHPAVGELPAELPLESGLAVIFSKLL